MNPIATITPDQFLAGLTVWTGALTVAIGIIVKFVLSNSPTIQVLVAKLESLKDGHATNTAAIQANTAAINAVSLATSPAAPIPQHVTYYTYPPTTATTGEPDPAVAAFNAGEPVAGEVVTPSAPSAP